MYLKSCLVVNKYPVSILASKKYDDMMNEVFGYTVHYFGRSNNSNFILENNYVMYTSVHGNVLPLQLY